MEIPGADISVSTSIHRSLIDLLVNSWITWLSHGFFISTVCQALSRRSSLKYGPTWKQLC